MRLAIRQPDSPPGTGYCGSSAGGFPVNFVSHLDFTLSPASAHPAWFTALPLSYLYARLIPSSGYLVATGEGHSTYQGSCPAGRRGARYSRSSRGACVPLSSDNPSWRWALLRANPNCCLHAGVLMLRAADGAFVVRSTEYDAICNKLCDFSKKKFEPNHYVVV